VASLVVDRVFDALVTLSLLAVAMMDPAFSSTTKLEDWTVGGLVALVTGIVIVAFAGLYFAVFMPQRIESMAAGLTRRVVPRFEPRVRELIHPFIAGLGVLRDGKRFVAVILWTTAQWVLNASAFWFGFKAVGIEVPFTAALFVQGVVVIGIAIPSGPAFVGPFQLAATIALAQYAIGAQQAAAWSLGYHLLTFTPITVVGLWYAGRLGLSLGKMRETKAPATSSVPP
jgi:uncharacterized protein (TIRG00374 family)